MAAKDPPVVSVAYDELVPTTRARIVTSPRWCEPRKLVALGMKSKRPPARSAAGTVSVSMVCVSLSVRLMLPTTCCWPGKTTEGPNAPTCSNEQSNSIVGIAAMAASAKAIAVFPGAADARRALALAPGKEGRNTCRPAKAQHEAACVGWG